MTTLNTQSIELLAPARNYDCAIEAIRQGADAIYIGSSRFGARAAAGNSTEDIARLVEYAHLYRVKIYVTLNTILYDDELEEAKALAWELYRIGVDALIIQDMALLQLELPPIALHASTQMNNCTASKVKQLAAEGFSQVVLARELSIEQIATIHKATNVPLEVFVHGALCVSYSGQCYASQYCFGRSANRGECAQFCRLAFDLEDANGEVIIQKKHLLSLKDMNRSDSLLEMLQAGVTSFKIEGRLKDTNYVKNITAYYRKRLDRLFKEHPIYKRSSCGKCEPDFEPQPAKSFNRGFTEYFLHERKPNIHSFHTPKALGEEVGTVKEIRGHSFTVAGLTTFSNGDGLCYLNRQGDLSGFRVNRVENNRLFPAEMPSDLTPKTKLYRNVDHAFENELSRPSAERKIAVDMELVDTSSGFKLTLTDEEGVQVSLDLETPKEEARTPQNENIQRQLSKFGNTPFDVRNLHIALSQNFFLPSSVLAQWRRTAVDELLQKRKSSYQFDRKKKFEAQSPADFGVDHLTYLANVSNKQAHLFYAERGITDIAPAFELHGPSRPILMRCKHCLRYSLGYCPTHQHSTEKLNEPLYLALPNGKRFRLSFDCKNCEMNIYAPE